MDSASPVFDRTPPFSDDAEFSVLGAMLIDGEAIATGVELLGERSFYRERNRRVFRGLAGLLERGDPPDPITLADRLRSTGELEAAGGMEYIGSLVTAVPTAANIEYHARIVREKAQLRSLVEASTVAIRDAYDLGERSVAEVISAAEERVLAVGQNGVYDQYVRVKDILWDVFERIEKRAGGESLPGIPTGLVDLDRELLGLHRGQVTVIAARPSMGKTSLALGWGINAAISHQVPTLIFSFEMTAEELILRALASEGRLDLHALRGGGQMSMGDHEAMAAAAGHLATAPLFVDDSDDHHISSVAARARRLWKRERIGLVIIDYLQLLTGDGENRREKIDSISRGCKRLARALDVPVVLVSQLTRGPEHRTDKRPMLSDLRESGGIEQDADNVVMIYRAEYYMNAAQRAKANGSMDGKAELIIPKQRNGPTGTVAAYFRKSSTRFENLVRPGVGGPQP